MNKSGIAQCFGVTNDSLDYMMLKEYAITQTGSEPLTEINEVWAVEVDDAALNQLMLDDHCFELVRGRTGFFADTKGIDEKRMKEAVEKSVDAFWVTFAAQYPEAKTGDLAPEMSNLMLDPALVSAASWVRTNVPEPVVELDKGKAYAW